APRQDARPAGLQGQPRDAAAAVAAPPRRKGGRRRERAGRARTLRAGHHLRDRAGREEIGIGDRGSGNQGALPTTPTLATVSPLLIDGTARTYSSTPGSFASAAN